LTETNSHEEKKGNKDVVVNDKVVLHNSIRFFPPLSFPIIRYRVFLDDHAP